MSVALEPNACSEEEMATMTAQTVRFNQFCIIFDQQPVSSDGTPEQMARRRNDPKGTR